MIKVKILAYDGRKGRGRYLSLKRGEDFPFSYKQLVEGKIPVGNFAWLDKDSNIRKKPSFLDKLLRRV